MAIVAFPTFVLIVKLFCSIDKKLGDAVCPRLSMISWYTSKWKGSNHKQSTRWQHISRLKASALCTYENIFGLLCHLVGWRSASCRSILIAIRILLLLVIQMLKQIKGLSNFWNYFGDNMSYETLFFWQKLRRYWRKLITRWRALCLHCNKITLLANKLECLFLASLSSLV